MTADHAEPASQARPRRSLWRHRDFALFWAGQSVSMVGSSVSYLALPLVGVLVLDANAFQMGLLATVGLLPPLLIGPFVGPLVDRSSRWRLMIVADVGRALLLASIPAAALAGVLTFAQLVAVGFGVGALSLLFAVAYQAFLPTVIAPEQLTDANGKLTATQSVGEVAGPGIAGWLMAVGGPPVAITADAASYLVSAGFLVRLKARDAARKPREAEAGRARAFWRETSAGFRLLWRDPILRTVTVSTATMAFFAQLQEAVYFLFLTQTLHFGPGLIGLLFSLSSVVGFVAAIGCDRLARRLGIGPLIMLAQLIEVAGGVLLATATGPTALAAAFILAGEACFASGVALFTIGHVTLRQLRTTDEVRGRVIGASRFLTMASVPVGALLGGTIGTLAGLRPALLVGAAGLAVGCALVLRPRIWQIRASAQQPAAAA